MLFDVAPLSISMETFTPGERFFTLTTTSSRTSPRWMCGTGGTRVAAFPPRQADADPGASGIDPLELSVDAAHERAALDLEGGAVFFETWMAGGLGRAQGGYDEMVWRAKVPTTSDSSRRSA